MQDEFKNILKNLSYIKEQYGLSSSEFRSAFEATNQQFGDEGLLASSSRRGTPFGDLSNVWSPKRAQEEDPFQSHPPNTGEFSQQQSSRGLGIPPGAVNDWRNLDRIRKSGFDTPEFTRAFEKFIRRWGN